MVAVGLERDRGGLTHLPAQEEIESGPEQEEANRGDET